MKGVANAMDDGEWLTDEDIKDRYGIRFMRTGSDESMVFEVIEYLGLETILNETLQRPYDAHIWKVKFYRVDNNDLKKPSLGLLQMKEGIWRKWTEGANPCELGRGSKLIKLIFRDRHPVKMIEESVAYWRESS